MNYNEELKDPRWQRKRLEKLSEAGWKCEICDDTKEELHVHHKRYRNSSLYPDKLADPWSYELRELSCLCRTCHAILHMDQGKVVIHAERLNIEHKTITFVQDATKYIVNTIISPSIQKYPDAVRELLRLQADVRLDCKALETSVKLRVDEIVTRAFQGVRQ